MLARLARLAGTILVLTAVVALVAGCGGAAETQRPEAPKPAAAKPAEAKLSLRDAPLNDDPLTSPRTEWFRNGKFGMFIHWGVYAVPAGVYKGEEVPGGGEWIMDKAKIPVPEYEEFAKQFNPTKFDATEWVRIAKDAGMTYMVITSKHHDGFCMWDSKHTKYDIIDATPFARDPLKELAEACRKAGITLCFYHSIMDWHHPDAKALGFPTYREHLKAQVKELITGYGPLGILWFDGEWIKDWDEAKGADLYTFCRTLQPSLMVNNRVGKRKTTDGDYETPEQNIPAGAIKGRLWETCMTMNNTWGFKTNDQSWKSTSDLIRKLIDIASKGGNFLLNVGPTAEGLIPEPSITRLKAVGQWLKHNGQAIYGTTASPWTRHPFDGRCTVKGNTLYVHVFGWDGPVKLVGVKGEVVKVETVDARLGAAKHEVTSDEGVQTLTLHPPEIPDLDATVIAVHFKDTPQVEESVAVGAPVKQAPEGSIVLHARDATVHGEKAKYESGGEKDNIGFWTNANDWVAWSADVAKPGTFAVEITYAAATGSGGSEYVVAVGDQQVAGKVAATGSWTAFKAETLGKVTIEKAGKIAVSVTPKTKPGLAVMNLQSIVLKPAKE